MKKLKNPIKCLESEKFKTYKPSSNKPTFLTGSHVRTNGFVCIFPKLKKDELIEPEDVKYLEDLHLKEWFIDNLKGKKGFHESNIQDAIRMDLEHKGFVFSKEGVVKNKKSKSMGRYDFLVKKDGIYYAIETKLDDDINAPNQLKEYIDALIEEGTIPKNKIRGVIICGRASEETKKEAKKNDFKVYEYKLDLNIPNFLN